MIRLAIEGLKDTQRLLDRASKEYERAHSRAMGNVIDDVRRGVTRRVQNQTNIPQRVVSEKRMVVRHRVHQSRASLWVGTEPVRYGLLGKPRQLTVGARAGRQPTVPGSFVARMNSGYQSVFRRRDQVADESWLRVSRKRVRREPRDNVWGSTVLPIVEEHREIENPEQIQREVSAEIPGYHERRAEAALREANRRIDRQRRR